MKSWKTRQAGGSDGCFEKLADDLSVEMVLVACFLVRLLAYQKHTFRWRVIDCIVGLKVAISDFDMAFD